MNYLFDIAVVLLVVLFMWLGYKKGIVRSILGLCSTFLSFWTSGFVSAFLANKIYMIFIRPTLFSNVTKAISSETVQVGDLSKVANVINCCPKFLRGSLSNYEVTNDMILSKLGLATHVAAEQITDMLGPVFINFVRIITMAILVTIFMILFRMFTNMICRAFRLPILKQINQVLGMIFGALKGVVVVFLAVFFVRLSLPLSTNYKSKAFSDDNISQTHLFKLIYHNSVYDDIFCDQEK